MITLRLNRVLIIINWADLAKGIHDIYSRALSGNDQAKDTVSK